MDRQTSRTRRTLLGEQTRDPQIVPASEALRSRNRQRARPRELVDAVLSIDTTADPGLQQQLIDWVRERYVEREGGDLIGLMAHCYLGADYVDHRLDMSLRIAEHYTQSSPPPAPFHMARPLARSTAYAYIELYSDGSIVPIRPDGTQAV